MELKGRLFLVVGNSGSGKDALLSEVMDRWPASVKAPQIPRRYITRPAHSSERYNSVTAEEFADLRRQRKFCLTWHVYHTDYGIPCVVLKWLDCGQDVLVNVSRKIIPRARELVPDLKVVYINVPLEVTLQRLKSRRREAENDPAFQQRLQRAKENQSPPGADCIIDNSGSLNASVEKLIKYLLSFG